MISQSFKMIKQFSCSRYWNAVTCISRSFLYLWIMQNLIGSIGKRAAQLKIDFNWRSCLFWPAILLQTNFRQLYLLNCPSIYFWLKTLWLFSASFSLFYLFCDWHCKLHFEQFWILLFWYVFTLYSICLYFVRVFREAVSLTVICQFFLNNLSHLAKHFKDWQLQFM